MKIDLKKIFAMFIVVLFFSMLALFLVGCGARKVDKQVTKEEIKTESSDHSTVETRTDSNVKTNVTTKVDDKNETVTEETTYEAKDPTKEASVIDDNGKKTILNNSKKTVKKITQKNNTQAESKTDSELKLNKAVLDKKNIDTETTSTKDNNSSKIDREEVSWFSLWMLAIPIVLILWLLWKYRDKIWWF